MLRFRIGEHLFVDDGPRIKEYDFDIEQDEEHRDEIEFHGHARVAFADGEHAAFVGDVLDFAALAFDAEKDGDDEHAKSECDGQQPEHQDGDILVYLRSFHGKTIRMDARVGKWVLGETGQKMRFRCGEDSTRSSRRRADTEGHGEDPLMQIRL